MEATNHIEKTSQHTIPEGWREFSLGELGEVKMCKRVMKYQTLASGEIPFYKIGTFGGTPDAYISRDLFTDFRSRFSYPNKGDILLSAAGTIGRTVVFDGEDSYFQDSNIVWIDNKEDKVLNSLLYYCYKVMKFHTENGGIVVRLYNENLRNTTFCAPESLEEQKRIADALTAVDKMIGALDEAIAKKRQIKEGLMQQLLTCKTRLPGFNEEWVELELGSILSYEQPGPYLVQSTEYVESGTPVLTAGKTFILGYTNEKFGIYDKLPVIIFDDFVTESKYVDFPFKAKSSAMKMLSVRDKGRHNVRFIYDIMQLIDFPMTDHKRYWIAEYSLLKVRVPKSLEEEDAIANSFSTIDDEIHSLESQRDKYRLIKQGMMQELLTGKTRLL